MWVIGQTVESIVQFTKAGVRMVALLELGGILYISKVVGVLVGFIVIVS